MLESRRTATTSELAEFSRQPSVSGQASRIFDTIMSMTDVAFEVMRLWSAD